MLEWTSKEVELWLQKEGFSDSIIKKLCFEQQLNGKCLLALNENDFTVDPLDKLSLRDRKCFFISVKLLQHENQNVLVDLGLIGLPTVTLYSPQHNFNSRQDHNEHCEIEHVSPPLSDDGRAPRLPPEIWKAFLSFCYVVGVTWITAFVMVIVHDRVPDMKRYPPLPDIFLDNVPHIPWAFDMCEVTGTFLFTIWLVVLLFHKHR